MSNLRDQQYLLNQEYKDASIMEARNQFFERFSTNSVNFYRWIFDHFKLAPSSHLLELGCGPGFLWQQNLDRIPPDWTLTLSDFSAGMLKGAQHSLRESDRSYTFQVIDAQAIPFETSHFDAVIANNMLYHVSDRHRALSEIHRVLKPEGYFYASTIGERSYSEIRKLVGEDSTTSWTERLGFSLENGAEQLSSWFVHVDLHYLENILMVTEAEPLFQIICSGLCGLNPDKATLPHLREAIDQELSQHGVIRVTMKLGLFVAHGRK